MLNVFWVRSSAEKQKQKQLVHKTKNTGFPKKESNNNNSKTNLAI